MNTYGMNGLMALYVRCQLELLNFCEIFMDFSVCRCSLVRYVPSPFRKTHGATGSQSTPYIVLDRIFTGFRFSEEDHFIDIGCGKGRVLAYMVRHDFPGRLYGVEMNTPVAETAAGWSARYGNISIISDDVFNLNLNQYTVFSLARSFLPDTFHRFVSKVESEVDHKITFFYWWDSESGNYLNDRKGWSLLRREWIFKIGGVYVATCPQRYSIWTFDPS